MIGRTSATHRDSAQLIVKFKSDGPTALHECAETLTRQGKSFRAFTADRSDSIDRLRDKFRVQRMRALFRRPP